MERTRSEPGTAQMQQVLMILRYVFYVLFLNSLLFAGEWREITGETFNKPGECGLSNQKITRNRISFYKDIDLDRDGDYDRIEISYKNNSPVIEGFLKKANGRLTKDFRIILSSTRGKITNIFSGVITDNRWPELIVEISRFPYIACFERRTKNSFSTKPVLLQNRFPVTYRGLEEKIEPAVSIVQVLDWDGDGFEDIMADLYDAKSTEDGNESVIRHAVYACFGGQKWKNKATKVLDLQKLGMSSHVLVMKDFDGDGSIEILLKIKKLIGENIISNEIMFLRNNNGTIQLVSSWIVPTGNLFPYTERDLNGDNIPDIVLSDFQNNYYFLLKTNTKHGRGFSFELQEVSLPVDAYCSNVNNSFLFFTDLNNDGITDFFTLSRFHNQAHLFLNSNDNQLKSRIMFLPFFSRSKPETKTKWYDKAIWFGDADGDGSSELFVLTNQVLNERFVPPKGGRQSIKTVDNLIGSMLSRQAEERFFAPYFRLFVFRVSASKITLSAKINSGLKSRNYSPKRIMVKDIDMDNKPELVLEVVNRKTKIVYQSVFKITGKLPVLYKQNNGK